jgi:4'-phosphopantetheinyl transferase
MMPILHRRRSQNGASVGSSIGQDDIHVRVRLTDNIDEAGHLATLTVLSADERERVQRFALRRDRYAFAAAHALLRQTLSEFDNVPPRGWIFTTNGNGKPVLGGVHRSTNIAFNLTHARGLVACALVRGTDIGIDAESVDTPVHSLELAERYFSGAEVDSLRTCADRERQARFVELWTLKEAYVKGLGVGLAQSLDGFSIVFAADSSPRLGSCRMESTWQFALLTPSPRHRLSVAARQTTGAERRIDLREVS